MSDKVVSKEGTNQLESLHLPDLHVLRPVGDILVIDGERIHVVAQTVKEVNDVLKNLADVMKEIGKVMHEADASLHIAGNEINKIKVPKIELHPKLHLDEVHVFGPTGDALVEAGDRLHVIGEHLNDLEKSMEKISKPNGSLAKLSDEVLDPVARDLKTVGGVFRKL